MEKDGKQCINDEKIDNLKDKIKHNETREKKNRRMHSIDLSSLKKLDSNDANSIKLTNASNRRR